MAEDGVEELPGLQFTVKDATLGGSGTGVRHGHILLRCTVRDPKLFHMAAAKLDGYRIFSSTAEEVMDALTAELSSVEDRLQAAKRQERRLLAQIADKDEQIAKMQGFFSTLEADLGIKP
jgi:septal ring factor EnvC (AmiA/AmiB activator)